MKPSRSSVDKILTLPLPLPLLASLLVGRGGGMFLTVRKSGAPAAPMHDDASRQSTVSDGVGILILSAKCYDKVQ